MILNQLGPHHPSNSPKTMSTKWKCKNKKKTKNKNRMDKGQTREIKFHKWKEKRENRENKYKKRQQTTLD